MRTEFCIFSPRKDSSLVIWLGSQAARLISWRVSAWLPQVPAPLPPSRCMARALHLLRTMWVRSQPLSGLPAPTCCPLISREHARLAVSLEGRPQRWHQSMSLSRKHWQVSLWRRTWCSPCLSHKDASPVTPVAEGPPQVSLGCVLPTDTCALAGPAPWPSALWDVGTLPTSPQSLDEGGSADVGPGGKVIPHKSSDSLRPCFPSRRPSRLARRWQSGLETAEWGFWIARTEASPLTSPSFHRHQGKVL